MPWIAFVLVSLLCLPAPASDFGPFVSPRHRDHPLVGTAWRGDAEDARWSARAVAERVSKARFVLLGETHDNADHHRLQARFVASLGAEAGPPALVFEMLDAALQPEIDRFVSGDALDVDAFARLVGWADSGWPDFALYRPLFVAGLGARLPILAAGAGRGQREVDPELVRRFRLDQPLPPEEQRERIEEMFQGHCELLPREQLGPMVDMQRARDARFAEALLRGAERNGRAVLIAGSGHVESHGVPRLLVAAGVPPEEILSLGMLEVDPELEDVSDGRASRFDVALFTPGAEREDPCEGLRRHFQSRAEAGPAS